MKKFRPVLFLLILMGGACSNPQVKTGYVEVSMVTKNALSGVYTLLRPTKPTVKLYYEECGQGKPLILIHDQAVDCRMWDAVFFDLAKTFRVIRYDLRGYGKSGDPESGYGFLHADDLGSLMDVLGIKKAHFAGLSLGGITITDFLAAHPERVWTATIASGALSEYPNRAEMPSRFLKIYNDTVYALRKQEIEQGKKQGLSKEKKAWKEMMRSVGGDRFGDISPDLYRMVDDWKAWQALHVETDAFMGAQTEKLLKAQKKHPRILLIIGQHDSARIKKSMQRMAALCPEAKIQLYSEAGHFLSMEYPERFVQSLVAFSGVGNPH